MIKCENCGGVISDDAKVCPYCSHQIMPVTPVKQDKIAVPQWKKILGIFLTVIGIFFTITALLGIISLLLISTLSTSEEAKPSSLETLLLIIFSIAPIFYIFSGIKFIRGGFKNKKVEIFVLIIVFFFIISYIINFIRTVVMNPWGVFPEAVEINEIKPEAVEINEIKDEKLCEKIDSQDERYSCYYSIAINKKEISLCEKAGELKDECIQNFK